MGNSSSQAEVPLCCCNEKATDSTMLSKSAVSDKKSDQENHSNLRRTNPHQVDSMSSQQSQQSRKHVNSKSKPATVDVGFCQLCHSTIQVDGALLPCQHGFHVQCLTRSLVHQCQGGLQLMMCSICQSQYGADIILAFKLVVPPNFYYCRNCKENIIEFNPGQKAIPTCQQCQAVKGWESFE